MIMHPDGSFMYTDIFELNYALLTQLEFFTDRDGYVYNQNTREPIMVSGKRLKANIDPNHIVYAGNGDIMMEVLKNTSLVTNLMGYLMDKKQIEDDMPFVSWFIEENKAENKSKVTIKLTPTHSISTDLFENHCLKFVHAIFILDNMFVRLQNFDASELLM